MNKSVLMASAIAAGAAALYMVLKSRGKSGEAVKQIVAESSRHLTNAFSKAKHSKVEA